MFLTAEASFQSHLFCVETGTHYIALAGLELIRWTRMALDSQKCSCLCLQSIGIKGVLYYTEKYIYFLGTEMLSPWLVRVPNIHEAMGLVPKYYKSKTKAKTNALLGVSVEQGRVEARRERVSDNSGLFQRVFLAAEPGSPRSYNSERFG